jgi:multiple sugar transport system permease protein
MVANTMQQGTVKRKARSSLSYRLTHFTGNALTYLVLIILTLIFGVPFLWTVATSLKTTQEIYLYPPSFLPQVFQWGNFIEIWSHAPLATFFLNSVVVAVLSMIGQLLSASLVAYGFSRFRFPGRDTLFVIMLSTLMLPNQVTIIPTFLLFKYLGFLDTLKPLIVPSYFGGGAFAIFLFRQFFLTIPTEFDEAAKIDGASSIWIFARVLVPLAKPVLITMAIFSFLGSWNDYFNPLIYLNTPTNYTLAIGLTFYQRVLTAGGRAIEHLMMAAAMVMTFPSLLVFLILQNYYTEGIAMSGLKG